jgi:hypothetical protein
MFLAPLLGDDGAYPVAGRHVHGDFPAHHGGRLAAQWPHVQFCLEAAETDFGAPAARIQPGDLGGGKAGVE